MREICTSGSVGARVATSSPTRRKGALLRAVPTRFCDRTSAIAAILPPRKRGLRVFVASFAGYIGIAVPEQFTDGGHHCCKGHAPAPRPSNPVGAIAGAPAGEATCALASRRPMGQRTSLTLAQAAKATGLSETAIRARPRGGAVRRYEGHAGRLHVDRATPSRPHAPPRPNRSPATAANRCSMLPRSCSKWECRPCQAGRRYAAAAHLVAAPGGGLDRLRGLPSHSAFA